MDTILAFIQSHFPIIIEHRFVILFIGASLEGLSTMVLAGFLYSVGRLPLFPSVFILVAGYMVNSYLWYTIGFFGGSRILNWWASRKAKRQVLVEQIKSFFERYSFRAIVFAQATVSITGPTLLLAGTLRYSLKKFTIANLSGSIAWVAITFSLGYFFGTGYELLYLRGFGIALLFIVVALVLGYMLRRTFTSAVFTSFKVSEKMNEIGKKVRDGVNRMIE